MKSIRLAFIAAGVLLGLSSISCNGGSSKNPTGPGGGGGTADVVIHIKSGSMNLGAQAYSPDTATVAVGQTVQWVNDDAMVHTATANGGSFNTGNVGAGGNSAVITISGASGVRAYHCAVVGHNMTGALDVTP
jgi:plastocyanin